MDEKMNGMKTQVSCCDDLSILCPAYQGYVLQTQSCNMVCTFIKLQLVDFIIKKHYYSY